jgi:ABC-2 type transport system permease protein
MTALLHAELLKLRTTRTFVAITAISVAIALLIVTLVSVLTEPTEDSVLIDVFATDTSAFFILLLAVVGISGEWRHRTITSSLLAMPDRLRFLAAKAVAFAAAGVVLSLVTMTAVAILGLILMTVRDLPTPDAGELLELVGRSAIVAAMFGAFGVALGALIRNQIGAIVGVLVLLVLVEPTVVGLVPEVGRYGPFSALPTAITGIPASDAGLGDEVDLLAPGLAALALLAWIGAVFGVAAALLRRRDLN